MKKGWHLAILFLVGRVLLGLFLPLGLLGRQYPVPHGGFYGEVQHTEENHKDEESHNQWVPWKTPPLSERPGIPSRGLTR